METQEQILAYQPLFEHMNKEHGLILLESEMDEIILLALKTVKAYNKVISDSE